MRTSKGGIGLNISFGLQVADDAGEQGEPWLQDCVVSLSPCADLLVVAREQKAAFLSGQILRHAHPDSGLWSFLSYCSFCVSLWKCIPCPHQKLSYDSTNSHVRRA